MLLELLIRGCQVGPICQKKYNHMVTPERSLFSLDPLGCHSCRVDRGWWGIYTLYFVLRISLWDK
jgi:hypothetical protein